MKIRTRALLLLALSALILFGCRSGSREGGTEKIEISFFTMQLRPVFDDYFNELFAEFEKLHPNVKIKWMDYPAEGYDTKLITSFMGSDPPDVINLTPQMLPTFVSRGVLQSSQQAFPKEVVDKYFPNVIRDACQIKGKTYALPWYLATGVTMCNMKIFQEAGLTQEDIPKTSQEMKGIARIIREKTDKFPFFPIYTEAGAFRGFFISAGVPILDENETRALFNTPKGLEVFKFWTDIYKEGLVPSEALTAMHRRPIELYKNGKLAVFNSGPQFLKHVKADAPDVYKNTVVRPGIQWKDQEIYTVDVHIIVLSKKSKHPELAAKFAAFVTNASNQLKFCKLTTIIPSVMEAAHDPYFTEVEDTPEGKARKISAEAIQKAIVVRTPNKHPGKLFREMSKIVESVCLEEMTAEEGLGILEERWNEILGE